MTPGREQRGFHMAHMLAGLVVCSVFVLLVVIVATVLVQR